MAKKSSVLQGFIKAYEVPIVAQQVTSIKTVEDPKVALPYEYPESVAKGKSRVPSTIVYEEHNLVLANKATINHYDYTATEDLILKEIVINMQISTSATVSWSFPCGIFIQGDCIQRFYQCNQQGVVNTHSYPDIVLYKGKTIQIYFPTYYINGQHWFQISLLLQPFR